MIVSDVIRRAHWALDPARERWEEPLPHEYDQGLIDIQAMYDAWVASGALGRVVEVLEDAAYTPENGASERISNSTGSDIAITLPVTFVDDATGETVTPTDYALVVVAGATPKYYIRNALKGAWDQMSSLALTDYAPLSERGSGGLVACLAVEMVGALGVDAKTLAASERFRSLLSLKQDRPRQETPSTYF